MGNDCIFCKIINKVIPSKIIYEDNDVAAFHDINPQAPVHIMVVPKKHITTINSVSESDAALIGKIFLVIKKLALENKIADDGYRVVANCNKNAGQEVFHIHFHLIGGRKLTWPPG